MLSQAFLVNYVIKHFVVENFKSIEHVSLDCARINLFIGGPGTGKSNILESLGLLSHIYYSLKNQKTKATLLKKFVRYETILDLFRDKMLRNKPRIITDDAELTLEIQDGFVVGRCSIKSNGEATGEVFAYTPKGDLKAKPSINVDVLKKYKFFRFAKLKHFKRYYVDELYPPDGANLPEVLYEHEDLYQVVQSLIENIGLKAIIRSPEFVLELHKKLITDVTVALPYDVISDGIQNIIMCLAAIYSSKQRILIFEEPEIRTFPYFVRSLAERIAHDENNQYFISTHNPYFLLSIVEKASKNDVKIFVTSLENGVTSLHEVKHTKLEEIIEYDLDIFFNIDDILGED